MKKQRPTIPISEWRVAIHLEATHEIQNEEGMPAYQCKCDACQTWRAFFKNVLPINIQHELNRIGVELEHPSDVYEYTSDSNGSYFRVVYHAVGKIISGPNQWKNDSKLGEVLMYHTIRGNPYLSVVVFPQSQSFDASPTLKDHSVGDIIRIDFRICVPSNYSKSKQVTQNT